MNSDEQPLDIIWDSWHKFKSVNLWEVVPDNVYFIMVVQDSSHTWESWSETTDDLNNTLKIYVNWNLASEANHVDPQAEHHLAWIWAVNEWNVRPWDSNPIQSWDWQWWCDTQCLFFEWMIWELISWNHALNKTEIEWIQNYFEEKWLQEASNINYNTIDINIKNYN